MSDIDPLEILFVKGGDVDRRVLGNFLLKFVRLDEEGRIYPLPDFFLQANKNRLLILLLAKKALLLKAGISEPVSPAELSSISNIPSGSVRPTLRELRREGLVGDQNGKYFIFPPTISRCISLIEHPAKGFTITQKGRDVTFTESEYPVERLTAVRPPSMRSIIEDLADRGELEDGKKAGEIYGLVEKLRPETRYNSLYKVILDLVSEKKLARVLRGANWVYKKAVA